MGREDPFGLGEGNEGKGMADPSVDNFFVHSQHNGTCITLRKMVSARGRSTGAGEAGGNVRPQMSNSDR